MKAIILNSGMGTRLGSYTKQKPKCMVELCSGMTIIQYQMKQLMNAGIHDFIITTGYREDLLIHHLKSMQANIQYVFNQEYKTTNYIKSLDNIGEIKEDVLLMHGDLLFEKSVLEDVLYCNKSCMVIDKTLPLPKKDFKAVVKNNRIQEIGVNCYDFAYAAQPLYQIKYADWLEWKKVIRQFCEMECTKLYAEEALNTILEQVTFVPLDINSRFCFEVDTEKDLKKVKCWLDKNS